MTGNSSFGIGSLFGFSGRPSFQASLGSSLSCSCLLFQGLFLGLFGLHGVDRLQQDALVLELVTLGQHVEGMVNVLVNLLGVTHLSQKTTEDTRTAHPDDLFGKTGIGSTATLTNTYKILQSIDAC